MGSSSNDDILRELKAKHSDFKEQITARARRPSAMPAWEFLTFEGGEIRLNSSMLPASVRRSGTRAAVMRLGEVVILGFDHD